MGELTFDHELFEFNGTVAGKKNCASAEELRNASATPAPMVGGAT